MSKKKGTVTKLVIVGQSAEPHYPFADFAAMLEDVIDDLNALENEGGEEYDGEVHSGLGSLTIHAMPGDEGASEWVMDGLIALYADSPRSLMLRYLVSGREVKVLIREGGVELGLAGYGTSDTQGGGFPIYLDLAHPSGEPVLMCWPDVNNETVKTITLESAAESRREQGDE